MALRRMALQGLQQGFQPETDLDPRFRGGDTLALIGLRQRAQEARDARNQAMAEEYGPGAQFAFEREDPNLGTMSLLSQGLDEAGSRRVRFPARKVMW